MKKNTAQFLGLLLACVIGAGLIHAGLVASAHTSNDNDNKTNNGRVARRTENSNNNSSQTNGKPKAESRNHGNGSSGSINPDPKPPAENCKGKGCNQKGSRG